MYTLTLLPLRDGDEQDAPEDSHSSPDPAERAGVAVPGKGTTFYTELTNRGRRAFADRVTASGLRAAGAAERVRYAPAPAVLADSGGVAPGHDHPADRCRRQQGRAGAVRRAGEDRRR